MHAPGFRCGEFEIEPGNRRFTERGREIALEPRVFAVIVQLLMRGAGGLITRAELLDAVWGHRYVTPSTLNRTITLARRAFGDEAGEPRFIQTVHGAGYRFLAPVEPLGMNAGAVSRFGPPPAARLPASLDGIIGRDAELQEIAALVGAHRALTIVGAGGMGKTRCALEAMRRLAPQFCDGVWFFDLAPLACAEHWLSALAATLAIPVTDGSDPMNAVASVLSTRHAALLLDNCEHVAGDLGRLLIRLLRATEHLTLLVTSQVPLDFQGEQLMRMPPLALPPATCGATNTVPASEYAAVRMLHLRIRAIQPDFELTEANMPIIAEVCRRLDGMPLALELAAARFALLSPGQVLDRLDQRFRFLGSDSAGRNPRHRNLQTLLDWSYAQLSADERRLLDWISVFAQSWTIEEALGIAAAQGHEEHFGVELLGGLVDRSLVNLQPGYAPPRYRLLETVRIYAASQLQRHGETAAASLAFVSVMSEICVRAHAAIRAGHMMQSVELLTQEHANIAAALDIALRDEALHLQVLRMLGSLMIYGKAHGAYSTVLGWCGRTAGLRGVEGTPEQGRALLTYGVLQLYMHLEPLATQRLCSLAADIAASHDDWWTEGYARGYCALDLANRGLPGAAMVQLMILQRICERHADELLVALAGLAGGWIALAAGQPADALRSLEAVRNLGPDLHQRHFVQVYTGLSLFAQASDARAAIEWVDALQLAAAVGNVRGIAGSVEGCAYLCARAGEPEAAVKLLAAARAIRDRTGCPIFSFWLPHQQATLALLRQRLDPVAFEASDALGTELRQEDAAAEASKLLWRFAGAAAARNAQRGPNIPVGS